MDKIKLKKTLSIIIAAALAFSLMPVAAIADEPQAGPCSLTISVSDSDLKAYPELDKLPINAKLYKVANIDEAKVKILPLDEYSGIQGFSDISMKSEAEDVDKVIDALVEAISPKLDPVSGETISQGKTPDYTLTITGSGTLNGANKGLYLVTADDASSELWHYSAKPLLVTLPMNAVDVDGTPKWNNNVSMFLKLERSVETGSLKISKTLTGHMLPGEDAAFVFHVLAKYTDDKGVVSTVHDDVHTIGFTKPGTESIIVDDIPAGSVVTVEEVYSGRFAPEGSTKLENIVISSANTQEAAFTNTDSGYIRRGSSVENIYTYSEGFGYQFSEQIFHHWIVPA